MGMICFQKEQILSVKCSTQQLLKLRVTLKGKNLLPQKSKILSFTVSLLIAPSKKEGKTFNVISLDLCLSWSFTTQSRRVKLMS